MSVIFPKTTRLCASVLLLGAALAGAAPAHPGAAPEADAARKTLDDAAQNFARAVADSARFISQHPYYDNDLDRAAGMEHLARMTIRTLEEDVILDTDFPYFRVLDFRTREGGDNADQRYLFAPLRGGETYRVWGTRGSSRRLEFQLYAGLPWTPAGGRISSALSADQVHYNADGSFEILLSAKKTAGNWMENPDAGTMLMVRQIFSDWNRERPGDIHIDRVGFEGALKPAPGSAAMAGRLNKAAADLKAVVTLWPNFVQHFYEAKIPANTLSDPANPAAMGGARDRWMAYGHFDLQDDEALVLTTWPSSANYQGVQLTDMWFASLEYANRQSSLTTDQAWRSADGAYHFVIAARDPGVQNWLDTAGFQRGVILLRYDGMKDQAIAREHWPTLKKIKLSELRRELPADTPAFTAEMRRKAIEQRRKHVQLRYGV